MKVLIVEDEPVVAMVIEDGLLEVGIRHDRTLSTDKAVRMLEGDETCTMS